MARVLCTRRRRKRHSGVLVRPCDLKFAPSHTPQCACVRSPAWSAHSTGAHEGLWFLLGKILTPPTPRVLGTAESGEGVGWESRRERIGPAERGNPPVDSAMWIWLWGGVCGGLSPSLLGPWWRGGIQAVCHGLWGEALLGIWR